YTDETVLQMRLADGRLSMNKSRTQQEKFNVDLKLTFSSGLAIAVLINGFHEQAEKWKFNELAK
ncbi:unnamed protein product, partial [Sphenostylis stenocarpa]